MGRDPNPIGPSGDVLSAQRRRAPLPEMIENTLRPYFGRTAGLRHIPHEDMAQTRRNNPGWLVLGSSCKGLMPW
eukprot:5103044-Prymnesium_polylepis.2